MSEQSGDLDKMIQEKEQDLKRMAEKLATLNNELHDVILAVNSVVRPKYRIEENYIWFAP